MDGSDHHSKAEELAAKAEKYLGRGDGQATAAVWAAVAQVHATLALASTASSTSGGVPYTPDREPLRLAQEPPEEEREPL
jgi:hypothetical protein